MTPYGPLNPGNINEISPSASVFPPLKKKLLFVVLDIKKKSEIFLKCIKGTGAFDLKKYTFEGGGIALGQFFPHIHPVC